MKLRNVVLMSWCAAIVSLPALAQGYELDAGHQIGQGLARQRSAGDCLIVAPLHVVAGAPRITATDESGAYRVDIVRAYAGNDIAVLAFIPPRTSNCSRWNIPTDFSGRLSDASVSAVLRHRSGELITSMPVWVRRVDGQFITISPRLPEDHFSAGMSGAQLLVNGVFAGMFLSTEQKEGELERGQVMRSDMLDRLVSGAFVGPPVEGLGNRPPPPLGAASSEPDLVLLDGQSVIVGDRNTTFGVLRGFIGSLAVSINGDSKEITPGVRISFPDSRGECFIIYLRSEDGWTRHVFAIRCNPRN